jgi:hypothetical protein
MEIETDVKIENEGIKYGWKSIGINWHGGAISLKKFTIIKYKTGKIIKHENGNLMLCEKNGCFTPAKINTTLCNYHIKNPNGIKYKYCMLGGCCTTSASLGYERGKSLACKIHAKIDMHNVRDRLCHFENCKKSGSFSNGIYKKFYCKEHKDESMCDNTHTKCKYHECNERARYGENNFFCLKHKNEKAENLEIELCSEKGCNKRAKFGFKEEKIFCEFHAKPKMKISNKCAESDCISKSSYGFAGEKPTRCAKHKLVNMVSNGKKCIFEDCDKTPTFGFSDGKALLCFKHKSEDAFDVKHERCLSDGCNTRPTFALPGQRSKYCFTHKPTGAIDIRDKECEIEGCEKKAKFYFTNEKPTRCSEHFIDGMLKDDRAKKCIADNCEKVAYRGNMYSNINIHYEDHANNNEYTIRKRYPKCQNLSCMNIAKFVSGDDEILTLTFCKIHKTLIDIEMIEKRCAKCSSFLYIPSDKNLCANCGGYVYHRNPSKIKEKKIKQFLLDNKIEHIHNKSISKMGSSNQPDFLIDCKFGKIILEVDERSHVGYNKLDEIERMKLLYKDIQLVKQNSQVLFIRYNPDGYRGVQFDIVTRLKTLLDLINININKENLETQLGVIYLYYTDFDGKIEMKNIEL